MKNAIFLVALVLIAGCVQNGSQNGLYEPPQGNPSVRIISPSEGEVINSSSVGVWVNVTQFRLAAMDINREVREKMSSLNNVAFTEVPPGTHTLRVELRKSNHSLVVPPAAHEIRFTTTK